MPRPKHHHSTRKSLVALLFSGTLWRCLGALLSLVVFATLARRMGAQAVALYAVAAATLFLLQPLSLLGLQLALVRDGAARDARLGQVVRAALAVAVPVSVVLGLAVMFVGADLFGPDLSTPLRWVSVAVFASAAIAVGEMLLTAHNRTDMIGKIGLVETVARGLAGLVCIAAGAPPLALVVLLVLGRLATAMAYAGIVIAPAWRLDGNGWKSAAGALLATAPPYLAILLASTLLARIDMLVLARVANAAEVGQYAVALKTFEIMTLFSTFAMTAAYPLLARLRSGDRSCFLAALGALLKLTGLAFLPCAFIGMALARFALEAVFGAGFHAAAQMASLFVVATFLTMFNQLFAGFFLIERRPRDDLIALLASCAATTVLLVLLVSRYGALGAAWSVVGGSVVQLAVRVCLCTADGALTRIGIGLVSAAGVAALAAALGVWGGLSTLIAVAVLGLLMVLLIVTAGRQHCARLMAQLNGVMA